MSVSTSGVNLAAKVILIFLGTLTRSVFKLQSLGSMVQALDRCSNLLYDKLGHFPYVQAQQLPVDVFWINMDPSTERSTFMHHQLSYYGISSNHHTRISASTPKEVFIPEELQMPEDCVTLLNQTIPNFPAVGSDINSESPQTDPWQGEMDVATKRSMRLQQKQQQQQQQSKSSKEHVLVLSNCGRKKNTRKELVVTVSHLRAIYTAIYKNKTDSPYSLILEDDLQFAFEVDFNALIASAPTRDFGILQLVTSNDFAVLNLWRVYVRHKLNWVKRKPHDDYWCAGAYIINKEVMKPYIDAIITRLSPQWFGVHIIAGYEKPVCVPKVCCDRQGRIITSEPPCVRAPRGYQSDNLIYSIPYDQVYMLTVPIVTGAVYGNRSTLHQDHVSFHVSAFNRINTLVQEMKSGAAPKPAFINMNCMFNSSQSGISDSLGLEPVVGDVIG